MLINSIYSSSVFEMNLSLYEAGAGDGAGASGSGSGNSASGTATNNGNNSSSTGNTTPVSREAEINSKIPWHRLKKGKPAHLSSNQGVADPAPGSNQEFADPNSKPNTNDNTERWKNLIEGEFKDNYHNSIKGAVDERTANLHQRLSQANESNKELQNIVDAIRIRYPEAKDNKSLLNAINGDDSLIEQAAFDEGVSPEQYREIVAEQRQREQDIAELQRYRQEALQRERNQQIFEQIPSA